MQARGEAELQDRAGARLRDRELDTLTTSCCLGARAVTISTTATTIAAPAANVDQPIFSFRNTVPSVTATTGFTNA